ncbi:MAG: glucosamine-6-phosphate deaminase, partial [Deltaproteobacteria bacterium]|nr:glucosamine-6-phosphate deaminase [Deltaproteobacteria bacterium]
MIIDVSNTAAEVGKNSARLGAAFIRQAIAERGEAHIILATGASQFETLGALVKEPEISWSKVT